MPTIVRNSAAQANAAAILSPGAEVPLGQPFDLQETARSATELVDEVKVIVKSLNDLTTKAIQRVYRDQRKGLFPDPHPDQFAELATKLWDQGNAAYVFNGALARHLKEARGFSLREMGWMASMPQYAAVLGVVLGGLLLDIIPRRRIPLIFVLGSLGVALAVLLAINSTDRYAAAYWLTAASLCWGLQSPAIPSTVQFNAAPEHVACAFGVTNGVGSLVAGFMPAIMGVVIGLGSGGGLAAGFGSLVGTQVIVLLCGLALLRSGASAAQIVPGTVHSVTHK